MFLSKLSKNERYLLYMTITAVVVYFFDKIVVNPISQKMNKLNDEIFTEEKKLIKSLRILAQEDFILDQNKKYTQHLRQSSSDEEAIAGLLGEIETLANKSSVVLADIKPGPVEKRGNYKRYIVEIEGEATIGRLADFFYQIEDSMHLLRIRDFDLIPKEKDSATLKARTKITEILFF